jgi:hypothetical protein
MLKLTNEAMPVLKSTIDDINYQRNKIWYAIGQNNCNINFQKIYSFIETTYKKNVGFGPSAKPPWRARETQRAPDERVQIRGRELITLGEKILTDLNDLRTLAETAQSKWCIPGAPGQTRTYGPFNLPGDSGQSYQGQPYLPSQPQNPGNDSSSTQGYYYY